MNIIQKLKFGAVTALVMCSVSASASAVSVLDSLDDSDVETSFRLLLPAVTHHFSDQFAPTDKHANHAWQDKNVGLGLAYEVRTTERVVKFFGGAVVDSFNNPGVYAGGAIQWPLLTDSRFRADIGVSTMLWHRTVADDSDATHRGLMLATMPVLSLEDKKTGVGINLLFLPKFSYKERVYNNTSAVSLQLTYGF